MITHHLTATEVQNRFRDALKRCRSEPFTITKKGKAVAVMMSVDEYQRLVAMDERYWGEFAQSAIEDGFVDRGETDNWIAGKL